MNSTDEKEVTGPGLQVGISLKVHLHFEINLILKKEKKQTQKPEESKGRLFVFKLVL